MYTQDGMCVQLSLEYAVDCGFVCENDNGEYYYYYIRFECKLCMKSDLKFRDFWLLLLLGFGALLGKSKDFSNLEHIPFLLLLFFNFCIDTPTNIKRCYINNNATCHQPTRNLYFGHIINKY